MYKIILIIHVILGATALTTGIIPMFTDKGGKLHRFWGKVFFWAMTGVFVTTCMLFLLKPDSVKMQFLMCIGVLSYYLALTGVRVLTMKQSYKQANKIDWGISIFALACGFVMLGFAGYFIYLNIQGISILFLAFGSVLVLNTRNDLLFYSGKRPTPPMHWYFGHLGKIMGAYIAAFTAFSVNISTYIIPETMPWYVQIMPWLVPGFLIGTLSRRYELKKKLELLGTN